MSRAVVRSAVRTPIGRYGGALADVRPDDLAAIVIREAVARSGVPAEKIEDVWFGAANQAGEDNRNVARMASLLAGLPEAVAGVTVNRLCASGLAAVVGACHAVIAGDGDLFVAGGEESMSRAPFVTPKAEKPFERGDRPSYDTTLGWRFTNPKLVELFPPESMGETGENVAERWGVTREDQDAFALESQRRWAAADGAGRVAEPRRDPRARPRLREGERQRRRNRARPPAWNDRRPPRGLTSALAPPSRWPLWARHLVRWRRPGAGRAVRTLGLADRRADVDHALVLDRHERRADAEDHALDLVEELAVGSTDRDDDADLVLRRGIEALVAQRLEQPVAVVDACGLDPDRARHLVSSRWLSDPKSTAPHGATNALSSA